MNSQLPEFVYRFLMESKGSQEEIPQIFQPYRITK